MFTRSQYMVAVGVNFDDVKDPDRMADEDFMNALDRVAIAIEAFESIYCEDCEEEQN